MARKSKSFTSLAFLVIAVGVGIFFKGDIKTTNSSNLDAKQSLSTLQSAPASSLSLITEPSAGIQPIVTAINNAHTSIDLVMYQLEDPSVEQALSQAEARGVTVRVLLNKGYYGAASSANKPAYNYLQANKVPVQWTPSYFALTHQKTMVIDNTTAYIMTFNFTPQYYASSRDFGVIDNDSSDVNAVTSTFNSDWNSQKVTPSKGDDLVWSPGSQSTMVELINSATKSIDIYNEEMADSTIDTALENAAKRGVNVEVTMTDSSDWTKDFNELKASGVSIHTFRPNASTYIHAKMILVDNQKAFLGSENFSKGSLDNNRELGLVITDPSEISSLESTFAGDYQAATPY
jgi:cardiolipin synthase